MIKSQSEWSILDLDHEDYDFFDDTTVNLNNFMFKVGYRLGF